MGREGRSCWPLSKLGGVLLIARHSGLSGHVFNSNCWSDGMCWTSQLFCSDHSRDGWNLVRGSYCVFCDQNLDLIDGVQFWKAQALKQNVASDLLSGVGATLWHCSVGRTWLVDSVSTAETVSTVVGSAFLISFITVIDRAFWTRSSCGYLRRIGRCCKDRVLNETGCQVR